LQQKKKKTKTPDFLVKLPSSQGHPFPENPKNKNSQILPTVYPTKKKTFFLKKKGTIITTSSLSEKLIKQKFTPNSFNLLN